MEGFNKQGVGPKRITVGAGYGIRDWLVQRVTAVMILLLTLIILVSCLVSSATGYAWWAGLMANPIMQSLTLVTMIAITWHAWVGVRDIWMDYVKPAGLRLTLHVLTIIWLLACLTYAIRALWRI